MHSRGWGWVRLSIVGALLALPCSGVIATTAVADTAAGLSQLPTLDTLEREEVPLSNEGRWSAPSWATGTKKTGRDYTVGWTPYDSFLNGTNAAYWNPVTASDAGQGDAAAITMQTALGSKERYFSLWLNMPNPGSAKSGYELRWTATSTSGKYDVTLKKWVSGTATTLAEEKSVSITTGTTLAIADTGGTVSAWRSTDGAFTELISGGDTTYTTGYAGIEAKGSDGRSTNFKAGTLGLPEPSFGELSTLDTLEREEVPLSNEGRWSAPSWATGTKKTGRDYTAGWTPYDSFLNGTNAAYWNPVTASDAGKGDAAAITMQTALGSNERYFSLWLNMPNPGSAKSGYELRWTATSTSGKYDVTLKKWVSGTATTLAEKKALSISTGTTLAIVDTGGTVSAWRSTGGAFTELVSGGDSTYSAGYAGIEAKGSDGRSTNFKAGTLGLPEPSFGELSTLDALEREEVPLSNGGRWSAPTWVSGTNKTGQDFTSGWTAYAPFLDGANGAYWNEASYTDAGKGDAAAITMQTSPGFDERYVSLWLNMPSPASAKSGYELRWTETTTAGKYDVALKKWVSGTATTLAEKKAVSISTGTTLAIADTGETISAWRSTGGAFTELVSGGDSTYSEGYAGMEARGSGSRSKAFKAGPLSTPPDTTITSGASGNVIPDIAFFFESNVGGVSFECRLDAASWAACTSPKQYESVAAGAHTFEVRAKDGLGIVDPTPAKRTFTVVATNEAAGRVWLRDDFDRTELPIKAAEWTKTKWAGIIGAAWKGYGYINLGEEGGESVAGAYWNQSTFNDASGANLALATYTYPEAPPVGGYVSLWLEMPTPGGEKAGYEARFESTTGASNGFKVELAKWVAGGKTLLSSATGFTLKPGDRLLLSDTGGMLSVWTGSSSLTRVLSAADSKYSAGNSGIEIKNSTAMDFRAGNIDFQPPETTIELIFAADENGKTGPTTGFRYSSNEESSSFECSLDGAAFNACAGDGAWNASGKTYEQIGYEGLAEGPHTFKVRASDPVGNLDTTAAEKTWEVALPPETEITSPTPTYTSHEEWPVKFASDDAKATFECSLDGANPPTKSCTSPYAMPEHLDPGWHTFVVMATDEYGNPDETPAAWTFKTAIYPAAPSTSKLTSPEEGRMSTDYFTLKSEWGSAPEGGGVTGVTYQVKLHDWESFKTIPAAYVYDGEGESVSWPLPVSANPGNTEPVYFNFTEAASAEGWWPTWPDVKLRAVLDGGPNAAGATEPVGAVYTYGYGSPSDSTETLGPANLDLVTGMFTISRTDVSIPIPGTASNLEFTRFYNSGEVYTGTDFKPNSDTEVLGERWNPSAPVEADYAGEAWQKAVVQHRDAVPPVYEKECWNEEGEAVSCGAGCDPEFCDEWMVEDEIPEANWVEVLDSGGAGIPFDKVGSSYVAPVDAKEFKLTKPEGNFVLVDSDGTHTTFTQTGETNEYRPSRVSFQGTSKEARMVYEIAGGKRRLKMIIAPSALAVYCNESKSEGNYAPETAGCRSLVFNYFTPYYKMERLESITYYDATGSGEGQTVAEYAYDSSGRLIEEWDPRISPDLREKYDYSFIRITELTPPGREPWKFSYYNDEVGFATPLKSVSRASLVESPSTATTTITYDVPVAGEGAPYDMSSAEIAEWGQSDYPVYATAVFPPDHVPSDPPSDYSGATVYYMDPEGNVVNVASPSAPGVEGDTITTSEVDAHGNVVRSLSAGNRLLALKDEAPVVRAAELDSHSTYNEDGTRELESWGPLHEVRLESGEAVEARAHTTTEYDKGFEPKEGETWPNLPTKEIVGAAIPGQKDDKDVRVSETKYDWDLRAPTETIVDPGGLELAAKTAYNSQGQVIKTSQPSDTPGTTAGTTQTVYYTATNNEISACKFKPDWAGLPCVSHPVAEPSPAEGNPKLPWTWTTAYSSQDLPTETQEKTNGTLKRTTTFSYDGAGRLLRTKTTGEGTPMPATEITYNKDTGAKEAQHFVCEEEECAEFDTEETKTTYDKLGRVVEYEDADGNKSEVAYDLLSRPVFVSDGKGYQLFAYDEDTGVATEMTDSAAGTFEATYNADGQLIEQVLPNGLAQQITYDEAGAAVGLRYEKQSYCFLGCTWLEFEREYSIGGKVLLQEGTLSTQEYSYDKVGRLTLVKDTESGQCTTRAYAFDKDSNRTSMTTRQPKGDGGCDTESAGEKQEYEYDTADRLLGEGIEYDHLGRITSLPSVYSGGGKLTTVYFVNDLTRSQTQDGITNTYELDATRRQRQRTRTGSKEGTEVYHYAGGSDSPAWTEEGESWTRNIGAMGGGLGALQKSNGDIALQLADMHGDVVATADIDPEATELLSIQGFDEFGNPKGESTPKYGWLGAKGRRTELPSGVIQMGLRSYVPALGRFLTPDPVLGGSANDYDYANQDPVNNFDLTGEKACTTIFKAKLVCGANNKGLAREIRKQLLRRGRRLLRGTNHDPLRPPVRGGVDRARRDIFNDLEGITSRAVRKVVITASAVMRSLGGCGAGTAAARGCRRNAENEVRSETGPLGEMAAGCLQSIIPAWDERAGWKDLPGDLAKTVRKANVYFLAASCASGALGGP